MHKPSEEDKGKGKKGKIGGKIGKGSPGNRTTAQKESVAKGDTLNEDWEPFQEREERDYRGKVKHEETNSIRKPIGAWPKDMQTTYKEHTIWHESEKKKKEKRWKIKKQQNDGKENIRERDHQEQHHESQHRESQRRNSR